MKQVILMRHAKSSWKDSSLSDIERPLNSRGKHDAPLIGSELLLRGIHPDIMLVSSAERTRATAKKVATKLQVPKEKIVHLDNLYCATASEIEQLLTTLSDDISTVYICAHNPGVTLFGNQIPGVSIDNVPTAGVLLLEYDGEWSDFDISKSTLSDFIFPRQLID